MRIARTVADVRAAVAEAPRPVGLVPTMGALHDGYRVDLDVADTIDDFGDGLRAASRRSVETCAGSQGKPARLFDGQRRPTHVAPPFIRLRSPPQIRDALTITPNTALPATTR